MWVSTEYMSVFSNDHIDRNTFHMAVAQCPKFFGIRVVIVTSVTV